MRHPSRVTTGALEIPAAVTPANVYQLISSWIADESPVLRLDWGGVRRVDRFAGAIAANALIGDLWDRPVEVTVGEDRYQWGVLARASLLFALAQRDHIRVLGGGSELALYLDMWRRLWVPGLGTNVRHHTQHISAGSHQPRLPGFEGENEDPSVYGRYHAGFVNAHLSQVSGVRTSRDNVRHWLTSILPGAKEGRGAKNGLAEVVDRTDKVLTELLENVYFHGSQRTERGQSIASKSLVQLSVTLGGGSESFNRLYLGVQDTGPGVVATARPKMPMAPRDDAELLQGLFSGDLSRVVPRRGAGLPEVLRIVRATPDAGLRMATKGLELEAAAQGEVVTRLREPSVIGTAVVVMLPLRELIPGGPN